MKNTRIVAAAMTLALFAAVLPAYAADSAAGQKTFAGTCAACHQLKSYAGKSEADLQTTIKGIVAGTVKHPKKLTLNEADIANVAAYISSNEPK
jgi:mono/diheme cytochrome c family protein